MFKAIDLFAGIGGIRLGFEQAFQNNIKFVFTSEINKYSIQTYQENFKDKEINFDITKVPESDIPIHDILLAGFPCQAFSIAGLRKGFEDIRGTLFFDVARIIKYHMPKVIFLENVKGLVNHNKGNTFQVILSTLKDLGYHIHYKILNAKDFGVPQNRERIYIVGFKDFVDFSFPEPLKTETKLGSILESNVDPKYTISDRLWDGHQRRKETHKKKGNGFGYSLFNHESVYTSTISARYYKDGSEILISQENNNPRKITPRESARLQGFPDSFIIPVSDLQAYKQFGNTVCVPVIKAIANEICKLLADHK
ncbi:MAG: DNA cytosine methyltransferase [Neisseriales bacterium]|nr:MAG: DNA cytosine methyltransferase [Neisseriales bacterium]